MSGRFLLDANAVIARSKGDAALIELLKDADEVFIPSVVLGELYFGAHKSARVEANLRDVEIIAGSGAIIAVGVGIARVYGRIRQQLRAKGRPIPENDYWIAATAIHNDLTLLTRDAHFNEVDGLAVAGW